MKKVEGASRRPKWRHRALKVRLPDNSVSLAGHPDHCAWFRAHAHQNQTQMADTSENRLSDL